MILCVYYSSSEGSDTLQLAKAAQLPGLLTQQINQLAAAEVQLREKKHDNAQKLHQQYKVVKCLLVHEYCTSVFHMLSLCKHMVLYIS